MGLIRRKKVEEEEGTMGEGGSTVRVTRIPLTAIAKELLDYLEGALGKGTIFALEILTEGRNWKSKGHGRVQFETASDARRALELSRQGRLRLQNANLEISLAHEQIVPRPLRAENRLLGGALHAGTMVSDASMASFACWEIGRAEVMPERERVAFWVEDGGEVYKLEIRFGDIVSTRGLCVEDQNSDAILFRVHYAPRVYQMVRGNDWLPMFNGNRYCICKEDRDFLWIRTTDFTPSRAIGNSSCFCWELPDGVDGQAFRLLASSFPQYEEMEELTVEYEVPPSSSSELAPIIDFPHGCNLSYEVHFQLNSLLHAQKISSLAISRELLDRLVHIRAGDLRTILMNLAKLDSTCYNIEEFIDEQLNKIKRKRMKLQKSHGYFLEGKNIMSCQRALVTPTKVYFMGPEFETSNHVVRHFSAHASNFIRVSFVDEDLGRLSRDVLAPRVGSTRPCKTKIHGRVLSILRDGILFGTKRFEFLAFSASQLRANSVWMFASNSDVTVDDIRNWMGEFKGIRSVAKHAARMGQLFSSSMPTLDVPHYEVEEVPDVECVTDHVRYCFSDGIGKISLAFAEKVAKKCGLDYTPSAFQIRYGGHKGVVAVDPTSFRKLSLRPSMRKFNSNNTMLSVTNWSKSMPCFLNREIISLLSSLGVETEKFVRMQYEQMRDLDDMLIDSKVAMNVLESLGGGDIPITLTEMLLQGYKPNEEPYLAMMLNEYRYFQLSDMRNKCRIYVPNGRVLMGCLDETQTLEYGEVFIRVTKSSKEQQENELPFFQNVAGDSMTSIVLGKVVVTKNPCLHPGDVRVLRAIYTPVLEDQGLINCIVFPQNGKRPHPNECSGGDLDGDLYFVSWDENIIPPNTDPPMHYIGRRPRIMAQEVTLQEVQEFFVNYMINDSLGAIANAHLVHADCEPEKARSAICKELAMLHSEAVDFAKTGAEAEMRHALMPKKYPDFMERLDKPSYASPGVLGILYRATLEKKMQDSFQMVSKEVFLSNYDTDLQVCGFEKFLEVSLVHKEQYESRLRALMHYYGAESEHEILSGNLRNRAPLLEKDKQKFTKLKDRVLMLVKNLQKEARSWFEGSCIGTDCQKMASAWYHVTYHPDYLSSTIFLSFPWILSDVLLNIKCSRRQSMHM
ncbi:RNA-dependent RNA polymerase 2 [Nymphaea thermarum]|nr:RNA-dependent RNA polymerase 2 [Nymphaea thermarum]